MVDLLINNLANVNAEDNVDMTPISYASYHGKKIDNDNVTRALIYEKFVAQNLGYIPIVKLLLKSGAAVNSVIATTPLHYASLNGIFIQIFYALERRKNMFRF